MSQFELAQFQKYNDDLKMEIIDMLIDGFLIEYKIDYPKENQMKARITFEVSLPNPNASQYPFGHA